MLSDVLAKLAEVLESGKVLGKRVGEDELKMTLKFESRFVLLLFYILCLHAVAIFFFTRGFLLTRNELPLFSRCDDLSDDVGCNMPTRDVGCDVPTGNLHHNSSSCDATFESEHGADQHNIEPMEGRPCSSYIASDKPEPFCWTPPAVKRVVILVLDALRFDFVAPSSLFTDKPKPWMDKLQVMQQLIVEESSRASLFKFIADPPTTSLQRLKGLTTGSLPTFIDVGNSFGAPAIVEDNIIHQLANNGKKVIMMGDDTWLQLFPTQFTRTYPFPSFNVKDLHTVDDGVIENLFPTLYKDDWDVLIGHFLGVDHVGHIFGVESPHMVEKLEQYNKVVKDVVSILRNQSYSGGLHEDTLLLVMGDHGQTLNGDHGGGTAEEVETALFAWNTRQPAHSTSQSCNPSCSIYLGKENQSCICQFQQLDFAATLAAVLGVPFPFGSIGRVNSILFGLVAGTWPTSSPESVDKCEHSWFALKWMEGYHSVLCLNSWQVNRYFEQYAEAVLYGFSPSDLRTIHSLYTHAQSSLPCWSDSSEARPNLEEAMAILADGIERYTKYLDAAASIARSKWTQFGNGAMVFGLVILFTGLGIQMIAVYNLGPLGCVKSQQELEKCKKILPLQEMMKGSLVFGVSIASASTLISKVVSLLSRGSSSFLSNQLGMIILGGTILGSAKAYVFCESPSVGEHLRVERKENVTQIGQAQFDPRGALAVLFCVVYACSLLSNSFILKEQQMVTFFLVSTGVLDLRRAIQNKSKISQALCFLGMNFIMASLGGISLFKDTELQAGATVSNMNNPAQPSAIWQFLFLCLTAYVPFTILGFFFVKKMWRSFLLQRSCSWVVFFGVPLTYMAICLHWLLDDLVKLQLLFLPESAQKFARLQIPLLIYYVVALQTVMLIFNVKDMSSQLKRVLEEASIPCLGVWSGLILLLLGRQGPVIALVAGIEGWCLMDMQCLCLPLGRSADIPDYSVATIQWSLFSVQIFFCTGHRCAFDGLRYAAAFIGFDQFNIYCQGVLLAIDTFGASHILPVVSLALLIAKRTPGTRNVSSNAFYKSQMSQAFLLYGLVRTVTTIFTTVCVTIQRRHLMVWGLFAPKFVFDAIGLLVTDVILVIISVYYLLPFFR